MIEIKSLSIWNGDLWRSGSDAVAVDSNFITVAPDDDLFFFFGPQLVNVQHHRVSAIAVR